MKKNKKEHDKPDPKDQQDLISREEAEEAKEAELLDMEDDEEEDGADSHDDLDALIDPSSPLAEDGLDFSLKALPGGFESMHLPVQASRDGLQSYLRAISRFGMLKPEEEVEMARRVRDSGDPDAAFRLVSSHLKLVVHIAMDFQRRWMQNVLDLIQEGNVGLVKAVSKFDPEKGIKFSYYAAFWIKAYILKFIMDNWRLVKIGTTQSQRKLFYNLNKERQKLIALGFDPDSKTLAANLNVTESQIIEMEQRMDATDMSLDAPVNSEDASSASRMDYLPALGPGIEEVLANDEIAGLVQERLKSLLPRLSDKELFILQHRLMTDDPVTLREIGEKYDITRERVRQIEARLTQKIRDHLLNNISDFSQDWIHQ